MAERSDRGREMTGMWHIGTLWTGAALDWVGQLCLQSYRDHGHAVTLFALGPVANVPEGVVQRHAGDILAFDNPSGGEPRAGSRLWRDLFRLRMLQFVPDMLWVDPDTCCLRPLNQARSEAGNQAGSQAGNQAGDCVFAIDASSDKRISTALVGLPCASAVLADMLAFTGDPTAIAPFLRPKLRLDYAAAKAAGQPVPLSAQPGGIWGSRLLWYFLNKHRLLTQALPAGTVAFPAFPASVASLAAQPGSDRLGQTGGMIEPMVLSLAAAAPGVSLLEMPIVRSLLAKHRITPTAEVRPPRQRERLNPINPKRLGMLPVRAELSEVLDVPGLASFADVGGNALSLALAAQARHDCDLVLVDFDTVRGFPAQRSAWVAPYLTELAAHGIASDRVKLVTAAAQLRPCDLVCAFSTAAAPFQVNRLGPVLALVLHADSRFLVDIKKGSGGFPFLAAYGANAPMSKRIEQGKEVVRVCLRPDEPKAAANDAGWAAIARGLAGPDGFYRANDTHSFLFIPRGDTLVVTFDNLDIAMGRREDRRPWGFGFIEKQGWSMLGCMANGWTWYRDPWVSAEFDALASSGFFRRFERVVFYGASMGGYAACAFSGAAPGADVVAISPQSTVDKTVVPWESRYKTVWGADFSGKYGDAALASAAARRVTLLYDPFEPLDAAHAQRFEAANVVKLRAMMLGHRLGSSLSQMGILTPIILSALGGDLDEAGFYRTLRARRSFPRYQRELFERVLAKGHFTLARQLGEWVLRQGDNRAMREALRALAAR